MVEEALKEEPKVENLGKNDHTNVDRVQEKIESGKQVNFSELTSSFNIKAADAD